MFCSKCGKENEQESKFCKYCGEEIKEETKEVKIDEDSKVESAYKNDVEEPKVNSILSLVFSIILAPIGLILSIVGLVRCNKYKKESGKNSSYFGLNLAGLIISIIEILIMLFILFVVGIAYFTFREQDNNLKGTWNCSNNIYTLSYITEVKFDDNKFQWSKYNDADNNNFAGNYKITNRKYTNGKSEYNIILSATSKVINGKKSIYIKDTGIKVKFDKDSAVISDSASKQFYCKKAY